MIDAPAPDFVLAVDPGLRACGVALFRDGELVRAAAVRGPRTGRGPAVWRALGLGVAAWVGDLVVGRLVVETMKVYTGGQSDPDDLLELAGICGAVATALPRWPVEGVRAAEWNGQVPAEIRRWRTQTWTESLHWTDRVDLNTTQRFQQDVWSAVGIGRWKVTGQR
jgi:hypothetical protein